MKQLIIGLLFTFILVSCNVKNSNEETQNEEGTTIVSEGTVRNEPAIILKETSWAGEKISEDGKIAYHANILFENDTKCTILEMTMLIKEESELSNLEYHGTYEVKEQFIYITITDEDVNKKIETWKLVMEDDKIKYNSTVYGEFILMIND